MKPSLTASPILFLLFSKLEDGTGKTGTFDAVVKLMFSVTNSLLIIQHHDPLLGTKYPPTHENLGSKGVQRRWRTRVGLGPHGGVHRLQVLHCDHEPFTAMGEAGRMSQSKLEVSTGKGGCRDTGSLALLLHSCPPLRYCLWVTHRHNYGCHSSVEYPGGSQNISFHQTCGLHRSLCVTAGLGFPHS